MIIYNFSPKKITISIYSLRSMTFHNNLGDYKQSRNDEKTHLAGPDEGLSTLAVAAAVTGGDEIGHTATLQIRLNLRVCAGKGLTLGYRGYIIHNIPRIHKVN